MDSTAHRIIHQARSLLVDKLGGIVRRDATWQEIADSIGHGLDADQAQALVEVTQKLFHLMVTDPAPPECQNCATALVQAPTGRPRRFCSDACRQQSSRHVRPGCAHAIDARDCRDELPDGCPDAREALRRSPGARR